MTTAKVVAPLVGTTVELEQQLSALQSALAEETRRADVLNRIAAAIGDGGDLGGVVQAVVDGGVDLTGAAFGAFVYNPAAVPDKEAVVRRWPQSPPAGPLTVESFPLLAAMLAGAPAVRLADISADPGCGAFARRSQTGSAPAIRACVAASVVSRSGEVLGALVFGHPDAGVFPERLEPLIVGLAAQAAVAIDNARLHEAALREIEERRRAEAALAESEDRFHLIADRIPIICWMAAADGSIVWFNRRWYEYTGAAPGEAEGWGWRAIHHPDVLPEAERRWAESLESGDPIDMVVPLLGADGVYRPFLTRIEPARDSAGRITRWFGVNVDIAGETSARERLQFALEAGRLGSWELDVQTRAYEASDLCKANYGRAPDEPFGFDDLVATIHPEDRARMLETMDSAIRTGGDYDVEYRVLHPSGDERWMHVRGRAAQSGGARRMAGVSLDVTERKKGEERQRLLLNELNHRVKNTLATVQSIASQTLRHAADAGDFRGAFEARLLALSQTHNLLTSRNWEAASLREILQLELKPHMGVRAKGGQRVELSLDRDVRLTSKAAVSLGMAIHELATNAVKHGALSTPAGRVQVKTSVEPGEAGDDLVLEWRESSGPPVEPPRRHGFGGRVLEKGLAGELGGEVQLDYRAEGLFCRMRLPMRALEPKNEQ